MDYDDDYDDVYPSEADLERIRKWPLDDVEGLWGFIGKLWKWPDFGYTKQGGMWRLATGGWSGNESIIAALRSNHIFWLMCWQSSHRGGLFWFRPYEPCIPTSEPFHEESGS